VQEPVRLNLKDIAGRVLAGTPDRLRHRAPVMGLVLPDRGQATEVVRAPDAVAGFGECVHVEGSSQTPFPGMAERRARSGVAADHVPVAPTARLSSRMKVGGSRSKALRPDIGGEQGIECAMELVNRPTSHRVKPDDLAECVHAGVGPPRGVRDDPSTVEPFEHGFDFPLDGPITRLPLPSGKVVPGIFQDGVPRLRGHRKAM